MNLKSENRQLILDRAEFLQLEFETGWMETDDLCTGMNDPDRPGTIVLGSANKQ